MSNCPYAVTHEVENMIHVAKGPYHCPAPITQVERLALVFSMKSTLSGG